MPNDKRGAHDFAVGDKVRLTGKFLKSTGQRAGGEGQKTWKITAIERDWAVTDEVKFDWAEYFTPDEVTADPTLKYRRIALANLSRVGMPSSRDVL